MGELPSSPAFGGTIPRSHFHFTAPRPVKLRPIKTARNKKDNQGLSIAAMWWEGVRFTVTCSMDKLRNFCHQKRNQRPASLLKTPWRFHQCLRHLLTPVSNFPLFVPTGAQETHRKLAQTSVPARMQEDNVEPCGPPCSHTPDPQLAKVHSPVHLHAATGEHYVNNTHKN